MPFLNLRRDSSFETSERRFSQGDWMSAPEWISVKRAVDLSGYDLRYLQRLLRQGKVKAEKLPGMREWLVDKASLQGYVKSMKQLGSDKFNPHRND
jgi:hypothetical protein